MTKVTKPIFPIFGFCHFWFLLRCGCKMPFLATISESWSILEYFPYLDRFCTGKTRWDILSWILAKKCTFDHYVQNRPKTAILSDLRLKCHKRPKKGRHTPKIFLGVKWVHYCSGKIKAPFLSKFGRNLAKNVKIFRHFGSPKATKRSKFRPKLAEKQHLLKILSKIFLVI